MRQANPKYCSGMMKRSQLYAKKDCCAASIRYTGRGRRGKAGGPNAGKMACKPLRKPWSLVVRTFMRLLQSHMEKDPNSCSVSLQDALNPGRGLEWGPGFVLKQACIGYRFADGDK